MLSDPLALLQSAHATSQAFMREDLFAFMRGMHANLAPGAEYIDQLHLRVIARALEKTVTGGTRRLCIAVPPRHGKSTAGSVAYPAWLLGRDPHLKIICGSYGDDLAKDFAFKTRNLMQSEAYAQVFPDTQLNPKALALSELHTSAGGYRMATSVGGAGTGKGADAIVVDDPMKAQEAYSLPARDAVYQWLTELLVGRLDDPANGVIVVIMQRLHQDDLIGRLRDTGGWEVIELPGEAWREQAFDIGHGKTWTFQPGDLLYPEKFPKAVLEQKAKELGEAAYNAQILQHPIPPGGGMLKLKWFREYQSPFPRSKLERVFQSWDTAQSEASAADYSVCTTWGVYGKFLLLLDVFRERMPYYVLQKKVGELRKAHKADYVIMEASGAGISLIQYYRGQLGATWMLHMHPRTSKLERAAAQSPKIEQGRVALPHEAPWLATFEDEVAQFPQGKHDDQVDSMVQFLKALDRGNGHAAFASLSMFAG